jgi:hypothetical protein
VSVPPTPSNQPDATAAQQHELIRALRQKKSVPILAEIKTWLDAEKELVLPRSPMATDMIRQVMQMQPQ